MYYLCPVCNYEYLDEPPYNENGYGLYEICPCCGFQFGYDDYPNKDECIIMWRKQWIAYGCKWYSKSQKPHMDWDFKKQVSKYLNDNIN